jgi:uncharacterized membrane protein
MKVRSSDILTWVEEGRLPASAGLDAARLAGLLPRAADWRAFADRLLLWSGAVLLAAAVIFFFAYNWQALGRMARFGLAEGLLLAALLAAWRLGPDRTAGQAALLAAALLVGALLALVGQTYQTGADTFELFSAWAIAILPWALLGRMPALWLLWLALVNLAAVLWFQAFGGVLGALLFSVDGLPWALFAINTVALAVWEGMRARLGWLNARWAIRCVALASGTAAAALGVMGAVADQPDAARLLAWLAWTLAAYAWFRRRSPDLFVLAGGVLGVIVVVTAVLSRLLLDHGGEGGALLLIGLLVIAMSAAGSYWLRALAREQR